MKKITLLAVVFVAFTMNSQVTIWEESFEDYEDFDIEILGAYQWDLDESLTYGALNFDFENEEYVGTAIVFNSSAMTDADPSDPQDRTIWNARTGEKGLYMIAATSLLNDDYIITPRIDLTSVNAAQFSFWAKSLTEDYGLERFHVLLSTTSSNYFDFTVELSDGELQAPLEYTEYSYDLSEYEGQMVYLAIHYVAQDSFVFQMDDFLVQGNILGIEDNLFNNFNHYITNNNLVMSASSSLENIELYNLLGQEVFSKSLSNTNETINISSLDTGIYIAKVSIQGKSKSFKIVKN
ncbi:choice-of-anchor J domain-containing protein [Flavobacteriaceae bacterium]|nr:choice-of-anchor J domain-containing protein [Flavobacteriaceae bacterium]